MAYTMPPNNFDEIPQYDESRRGFHYDLEGVIVSNQELRS